MLLKIQLDGIGGGERKREKSDIITFVIKFKWDFCRQRVWVNPQTGTHTQLAIRAI